MKCLESRIKEILPLDKKVLFVCIGTDRATGDALGPLVGTKLSNRGYEVLGTLDEPVHALNLEVAINLINTHYPEHFVIAIDAALGQISSIRKIKVVEGPLKPGRGTKAIAKSLKPKKKNRKKTLRSSAEPR